MGLAMAAAGLALAPVPAIAQSAPAATGNTPASDAIGPRELQDFNLNGTVTRPADTPPATTPAPTRTRPQPTTTTVERAATPAPVQKAPERRANDGTTRGAAAPQAPPPTASQSSALDLPTTVTATPASIPQPGFASEPGSTPASLAPDQKLLVWPWLLLALVLGFGGALILWRRRSRETFAGGPEIDAFVAPDPAPSPPKASSSPRPATAPTPPAPEPTSPKPVGLVSSRLRPWVEIGFAPLGCAVDDDQVVIEFEIQLTNSGSAPARDVLVEASMFNAGASQDHDIGGFFANPRGQGDRIGVIAPLQQISIRHSLVAPRQHIQVFEVAGKQVFVPLVAFNVLYRAGASAGQTSGAFMVGRETRTEKLGPLRIDLGSRVFSDLGTRPLEIGIRT